MDVSEINKLRAWDYINKEMHNDFLFMKVTSENEEEIPSGIIFQSDKYKHDYSKWPPELDNEIKFIIMQWLHAKDKHGTRIYQYDLVEVLSLEEKIKFQAICDWGQQGCAYCFDINSINENNKLTKLVFFDNPKYEFKVIGNAFENPIIIEHLVELKILQIPI